MLGATSSALSGSFGTQESVQLPLTTRYTKTSRNWKESKRYNLKLAAYLVEYLPELDNTWNKSQNTSTEGTIFLEQSLIEIATVRNKAYKYYKMFVLESQGSWRESTNTLHNWIEKFIEVIKRLEVLQKI